MAAVVIPDIEERYLLAILEGADGLDLAEWSWNDPESPDNCYRAWDFQWKLYTCSDMYQIDQGARAVGKTVGIKMRAGAFPFAYEGQSMLLTAPELNHLRPLTDAIEKTLLTTRLVREMLPDGKGKGIARQPHWQVRFSNGTSLVSRLPNKDGKGVKGQHVINIEIDEAQNFSGPGWVEVVETLNSGLPGAVWRCLSAGRLILTKKGWVPIEKIQIGDEVWTHRQRWRSVLTVFDNGFQSCVSVAGQGHFGLEMTADHEVWSARSRRRKRDGQSARVLGEPGWHSINDVAEVSGRWASPQHVRTDVPIPEVAKPYLMRHRAVDASSETWLWLYGHFLAEGYACSVTSGTGKKSRRTHWCVNDSIADKVAGKLHELGIASHRYVVGHSVKVVATRREVADWMEQNSGRLAANKELAPWVYGLSKAQRQAVLDGMLAGDGSWSLKRQRWEYGTTSPALAFGTKLLAQSLGFIANVHLKPAHPSVIEGRTVNTRDLYAIQITPIRPQVQSMIHDGHVWGTVKPADILSIGQRHVFDLEIEDDHSFVAEGIVVSNCHGVSRGIRDKFFEKTQPQSGWTVHRPMAMHRPTWSAEERENKIKEYGQSRQSIDYRRNIYGEHGDASNAVFVLSRLMDTVDLDEGSTYNSDIYTKITISYENFPNGASDDERLALIHQWIDLPGTHRHGYSQKIGAKEVGSPNGYSSYWGGMDVGVTVDPSEILVFGQRTGTNFLELILRIQMHRINTDDQMHAVAAVMDFYGVNLRMGIDKTGVGFPIWDQLTRRSFGARIYGFGFSEKRVVAFEDRELVGAETIKDLAIYRNFVEASTDWLRNDYVDIKALRLPYDKEVLQEFQGQTYVTIRNTGDPYGTRRLFSGGTFHTLDAAKIAIGTKHIPPLEEMLEARPTQESVLDVFVGM